MWLGHLGVRLAAGVVITALAITSTALAEEPNEIFFTATILPPGVLHVEDEFGSVDTIYANTLVGSRGLFGDIEFYDDDSSPLGDGRASALYDIPTSSGSINFAVTGSPDDGFFGAHSESGDYEAYVSVFDMFGEPVDAFTVSGELTPGVVNEYSFNDFNWFNGTYNVAIDNLFGGATGDVDFFTFTGLTPGADFSAETFDQSDSGVDTILAWYDATGVELMQSDDDAGGVLSLIEGIVPASGELTFAVSAHPDYFFTGDHLQLGSYELIVTLPGEGLAGDFNGDLVVDAADYTVWRDGSGTPAEYAEWADNYGSTAMSGSVVPEPSSAVLVLGIAALVASGVRR